MHPNPSFRNETTEKNIAFARARGFGVLAANGSEFPMISHIPFLIDKLGTQVDLHLVRSNPIARALKSPMAARIAVTGPDSYISPDWYEVADQVPTWNYIAVHLSGSLELRPQEELRVLLDRQSAFFEQQLLPKSAWTTGKMSADALDKMMRQIVPCRMTVDKVDGTWKLNQNKPDEVRLRAAEHVDAHGIGAETRALAALMRDA